MRVDVADRDLAADGRRVREALRWHRGGVQKDHKIEDSMMPVSYGSHGSSSDEGVRPDNWWRSWDPAWDEGWDWESKWHPESGKELEPRDDPRRPKGPLLLVEAGGYRAAEALHHSQVTAALVAAYAESPGEVVWQALCKRAELVAVSFTPAELVAVVRCVSERQPGQLKLLWKLATVAVEKLGSFTEEDLVALASDYSSLDVIHHGFLNVVALILADEMDERRLTPPLAVELLAAFARANYPLPLLVDDAKSCLLSTEDDASASSVEPAASALTPASALSALESLAKLRCLDGKSVAELLPAALGWHTRPGVSHPFRLPSLSELPGCDLAIVCNVCQWASSAQMELEKLEAPSGEPGAPTGAEALDCVLAIARESLSKHELRQMRVVRVKDSSRCVIPFAAGAAVGSTGAAVSVEARSFLATAELLVAPCGSRRRDAGPGGEGDHAWIAGQMLAAAASPVSAKLWALDQQVRWLQLAVRCSELGALSASLGDARSFLQCIAEQPRHTLVPHAPAVLRALPPLVAQGRRPGAAAAAAVDGSASAQEDWAPGAASLVAVLGPELRRGLFRLNLRSACDSLRGLLVLGACDLDAEHLRVVRPEAALLFKALVQSLPAKLKAEGVFHKRSSNGVDVADVVSWCELLADRALLQVAAAGPGGAAASRGAEGAPDAGRSVALVGASDAVWRALAGEAAQGIIACGEPDGTAVSLLCAFKSEGAHRGWDVSDEASPLGIVAAAVEKAWRRAVTCDGELEAPEHEPLPIAPSVTRELSELFHGLHLSPPAGAAPPGAA